MELTWPEGGGQSGFIIHGLEQGRPGEGLMEGAAGNEGRGWRAALATGLPLVVSWIGLGCTSQLHAILHNTFKEGRLLYTHSRLGAKCWDRKRVFRQNACGVPDTLGAEGSFCS